MRPSTRRVVAIYSAVLLAAIAQAVYADAMHIRGARPDFLTATTVICALFCDANVGAGLGFLAGLLMASLTSPPKSGFGSLIVSRTLIGFGVGWLEERIYRDNGLLAVILVGVGTLLTEGVYFILSPQRHLVHWASSVVGTTLCNLILAYPLYLLLRRWLGPLRLRDPY